MATLTALFSALSRKMADVLRAVLGWSISSLFGRLTPRNQAVLSVALVLALLWPVFVLGAFLPSVAARVIAFVPIEGLGASRVFRVVWIALAVVSPVIVGLLTRLVSPELQRKSLLRTLLNGYPLTLGYAGSFLIALVTVPAVKIATLARRWDDQHIPLQVKKDHYHATLEALCDACAMAGLDPRASAVPPSMALSTRVINWFSRGAVSSLVISTPLMVRARGIELFLYPGDLLMRGEKRLIARVRSMMNRTLLERHAYLVQSEAAQTLQDELGRLWDAIARHHSVQELGPQLKQRLKAILTTAAVEPLSFEDASTIERLAARVELALNDVHSINDEAGVTKTLSEVQGAQPAPSTSSQVAVAAQNAAPPGADPGAVELFQSALRDARELMTLEIALARRELADELRGAKQSAVGFAVALAFAVLMLAGLTTALVLAFGGTAVAALAVSGGFLALGLVAGGVGYSLLPRKPLSLTRKRIVDDFNQVKEHLA